MIYANCSSCGENMPEDECYKSRNPCGHHCNHSWSHDECCWCGASWHESFSTPGLIPPNITLGYN